MSKINDLLTEAKDRLTEIEVLAGKIVIAYNENDLLDALKTIRYPGVGVVYEGSRSIDVGGPTAKTGLSSEVMIALVLIEQGDAIVASAQKRTRSIDYLDLMRDQFMGQKSTVTQHFWKFVVESPVEIKSGMLVWVQRWSVPVQFPPNPTRPPV